MFHPSLEDLSKRDWLDESATGDVRFALVGTGWWTREQAIPAIDETDRCEVTVVVDRDERARNAARKQTDALDLTPAQYADGVGTENYDAVYIATPNGTHLDLVEVAAKYDKAILCEKPLEASVDRARQLVAIGDAEDVPLMVGYRMQTEPLVRRTRELLGTGVIGEPRHIHSDMSATLLDINPDPNQWRLDPELAGGCALIDLGIYPINTIRFLLQDDPIAVSGTTWSAHEAFSEVDEHVSLNMQFPEAISAMCTASHNACDTSNLRIIGQDGSIELTNLYHPWMANGMIIAVDDTRHHIEGVDVDQMVEEFEYFANCLLTERQPNPDGHHALRDMEIIEAVYESADSESLVTLD